VATALTDPKWALERDLFRGGLAGTIAGVVFVGAGSRIVMRISALLNPEMRGVLTDNENVIGDITVGGTIGLVAFIGIIVGLAIGLFWVLIRDWLPSQLLLRALLAGLLAALIGGAGIVDSDNEDFHRLEPVFVHIVMFLAIVMLAGVATALLDHLLQRHLPSAKSAGNPYAVLVAIGGFFAVLGTIFFFGGDATLFGAIFFVLLIVATVLSWRRYFATASSASRPQPWLRLLAVGAIAGLTINGTLDLIDEINALL
jgi:hypothetical protein